MPGLQKQLTAAEESLSKANGTTMVHSEVTEEHIAQVVSKWTGIPIARLVVGQRERLLKMEDEIRRHVVGQEEAVTAICNAVRRNRAGLGDPNRPSAYFYSSDRPASAKPN